MLLSVGFFFVAVGVFLLSRITVDGSYWTEALPGLLVMAFGSGILFSTFGVASMHDVSGQDASLAAGVQSTAQQVGGAVGLAVLSTIALRHAHVAVVHGVTEAAASTSGAALAFRVGAGVALAGGILVALVRFGGPSDAVVSVSTATPVEAGDVEPAPA